MTPGLDADKPLDPFRSGELGPRLQATPILLTDVNGLLETGQVESVVGADGIFTPRTGRGFPFLVEVERLAPPPPQLPGPIHTWRLDKNELPAFLYACYLFGVHGILTLRDGRIYKQLHFSDGWVRSAASSVESDWLGKMLLARHQVTPEALNEVERTLASSGKKIGEEFVSRDYLTDHELTNALNQQYASIAMSVFEWEWAEVSFDNGSPNPGPHLGTHPFHLLVTGLNYGFTEAEIDELLGGLNAYPTPMAWTSFRLMALDLNDNERRLLASVNGQHSMSDLIDVADFSAEATKKFLFALTTIRAIVMSIKPRDLPVTFDEQIGGDNQAMLETSFFQQADEEFETDTFNELDFADVDEEMPPWWQQLSMVDVQQGVRYILIVILALISLWVGIQSLVEREVDSRLTAQQEEWKNKQTQTVFIKKPVYVEADRLLAEAMLQLHDQQWDGVAEARSLIGGALAIDPRFDDARDLAASINLLAEAKVVLEAGQKHNALSFLQEVVKRYPENPLLPDLLAKAGVGPMETATNP